MGIPYFSFFPITISLHRLLKQLLIVDNKYVVFTFQNGNVSGGFHGYPFKLLGETLMGISDDVEMGGRV